MLYFSRNSQLSCYTNTPFLKRRSEQDIEEKTGTDATWYIELAIDQTDKFTRCKEASFVWNVEHGRDRSKTGFVHDR